MTAIPAADRSVTRTDNDPLSATRARVEAMVAVGNAWAKVPEIETPDQAAKCEDAFVRVRKEIAKLDEERKEINKPLRKEIDANNETFDGLSRPLRACLDFLSKLRTGWLRKEQARQDRERLEAAARAEEAARVAREATEAAAKASTVEDIVIAEEAQEKAVDAAAAADAAMRAKPQIRGEFTSRAGSFRTFWSAELTDLDAALAFYMKNPATRAIIQETVQAIADAHARKVKSALGVPGVRVKSEERAV